MGKQKRSAKSKYMNGYTKAVKQGALKADKNVEAPQPAPEITEFAISNHLPVQEEPIILMDDKAVSKFICEFVALRQQTKKVEYELSQAVIRNFNELSVNLDDVANQVEVIYEDIQDKTTLDSMMRALKFYVNEATYKNKTTGYRLPLDTRLVKIVDYLHEMLFVQFSGEEKKFAVKDDSHISVGQPTVN